MAETIPGGTVHKLPADLRAELAGAVTTLTAWRQTGLAGPRETGPVAHAMAWAYAQPDFAVEELIAQFDFVSEQDIRDAVDRAASAGALTRL